MNRAPKYIYRAALLFVVLFSLYAEAGIVGTTRGEFSVNQGTANYSLKIDVPPGVAGMEPKLSLDYSSGGGNGYMGTGWGIGGVSVITRCAQTKAVDGTKHKFGVKYDENDRLCLDGQRLIAVSGAYGKSGTEYRTEIDTYSRIIQKGIYSSNKGPNWFEVKTKSGLTYRYGLYGGSGGSASAYLVINGRKAFWKVSDITDTFGNRITFHYKNNYKTGENYLDKVTYANNTVDYVYESREDKRLSYSGGHPINMTVRLKEVIVKTASTEVRRYRVKYAGETPAYKSSRVVSVTEHVPEGDLKPLYVSYQNGGRGFSELGSHYMNKNNAHYFADFNGDGFPDRVECSKNYIYIYTKITATIHSQKSKPLDKEEPAI